jgi:DNA-binding NarL/FixJ family response regulator
MLRVLVVEERQEVRAGFKRLLAAAGEITVVGEAGDTAEAHEIAGRVDCDLLVLGIVASGHKGIEEVRCLRKALPGLHLLTVGPAAGADETREAVAQGASGYVDINQAREDLVKAVRAVCRGSVFVSLAARQTRRGRAPAAR